MYSKDDFIWDEGKNRSNFAKHGITFESAATIFEGMVISWPDRRKEYGEERSFSLGRMEGVIVIAVIHTQRDGKLRLISARRTKRKERMIYEAFDKKGVEGVEGNA